MSLGQIQVRRTPIQENLDLDSDEYCDGVEPSWDIRVIRLHAERLISFIQVSQPWRTDTRNMLMGFQRLD